MLGMQPAPARSSQKHTNITCFGAIGFHAISLQQKRSGFWLHISDMRVGVHINEHESQSGEIIYIHKDITRA